MSRSTHIQDCGSCHGINVAATALGLAAVFLVLAAFPADVAAMQFNATVRGKVTDADGNPLEGVKVTLEPRFQNTDNLKEPIVAYTSDDGQYQARNVWTGDVNIMYEFEGYEPILYQRKFNSGPVRVDQTMVLVEVPDAVLRANVANESYQMGREAFNAGNYAEVISQMETAIEAMEGTGNNESLGFLYALKGRAHLEQRQFDEATDAYSKWVENHPGQSAPLVELAQVLSESGDHESAAAYFGQALELQPDDAMTRYNVGVIMVNAGNLEGGIQRLMEAIELQPEYPQAYVQLGYAYARAEEYTKAVEAFEKYIEQSPDAEDVPQIQDFITALKDIIGG